MPTDSDEDRSISFPEVFQREIELLQTARLIRGVPKRSCPFQEDIVGLAFSGGGIRSATFNLGVIQALAKNNILTWVDYLSTVSGGGYIGSWLSSWAYHLSEKSGTSVNHIAEIETQLNRSPQDIGDSPEPPEVFFLRKYSNYLTPRLGALSGDTLAFAATYIRNLLLNQIILIGAFLALLLVPRAVGLTFEKFNHTKTNLYAFTAVGVLLLVAVFVQVLSNVDPKKMESARAVVRVVAVPLFLFCMAFANLLWQLIFQGHLSSPMEWDEKLIIIGLTAIAYVVLWVLATIFTVNRDIPRSERQEDNPGTGGYLRWAPALWAAPAGLVAGVFILLSMRMMQYWNNIDPNGGSWIYFVTYGIPVAVAMVLLVGVVHLGLIGRTYEDGLREWWARLGGIVLAIAICWFLVSLSTLLVPKWLELLGVFLMKPDRSWATRAWKVLSALGISTLVGGWITATVNGLLKAKSTGTGPQLQGKDCTDNNSASKGGDIAARIAPPVFAAGLIIILSVVLYFVLPMETMKCYSVLTICVGLYALSRFFGYRVDVNEFSLHNAYRNRIVRCYLGATHEDRRPQSFTGFDESDNICLAWLAELGIPFHILNATLNVVKGKELALQTRKARSFVFTPLYSGFDYTGDTQITQEGSYRLTKHASWKSRYPGGRLGNAMAISGAAASPNMGHYTTGAVSFLLTIFCVRLGWWMGNPKKKADWESGHPRSSWRAVVNELTGNTDDDQNEVYLSDGGHFDNLGIYELVRRRCRLIIACDAGADPRCICNDLASAIEKCRIDFGTQVEIPLDDIRPVTQILPGDQSLRISKSPFAVGTIQYPDNRQGTLIYVKPSLNAKLPQDVLAYARLAQSFPHQSTIDQFFDEAQFESYRSLGFACASAALGEITKALKTDSTEGN
jgi:predicted acylesterase/phospholipase RssA